MADTKTVNGVEVPLTAAEEADIAAKEASWTQEKSAYSKVQYLDQRAAAYPAIQDQLLAIWNSMDTGEIPQSKAFYNAIKTVNDKYPAPAVV
jgi:hypothetical protein